LKLRWKIAAGLAAAGALCVLFLVSSDNKGRNGAEKTRHALRQQGFKTEITEFDFSISYELRARAGLLTMVGRGAQARRPDTLNLMTPMGSNAALVVWKQDGLTNRFGEDFWSKLRESLSENRVLTLLLVACSQSRH
jgi:hypothetical protein